MEHDDQAPAYIDCRGPRSSSSAACMFTYPSSSTSAADRPAPVSSVNQRGLPTSNSSSSSNAQHAETTWNDRGSWVAANDDEDDDDAIRAVRAAAIEQFEQDDEAPAYIRRSRVPGSTASANGMATYPTTSSSAHQAVPDPVNHRDRPTSSSSHAKQTRITRNNDTGSIEGTSKAHAIVVATDSESCNVEAQLLQLQPSDRDTSLDGEAAADDDDDDDAHRAHFDAADMSVDDEECASSDGDANGRAAVATAFESPSSDPEGNPRSAGNKIKTFQPPSRRRPRRGTNAAAPASSHYSSSAPKQRSERPSFAAVKKEIKNFPAHDRMKADLNSAIEAIERLSAMSRELPEIIKSDRMARVIQLLARADALWNIRDGIIQSRLDETLTTVQRRIDAERERVDAIHAKCNSTLKHLSDSFNAKLAQAQQEVDGMYRLARQPLEEVGEGIEDALSQPSIDVQFRGRIGSVLHLVYQALREEESALEPAKRTGANRDGESVSSLNDISTQLERADARQRLRGHIRRVESLDHHQQRADVADADNDRRTAAAVVNALDDDDDAGARTDLDGVDAVEADERRRSNKRPREQ